MSEWPAWFECLLEKMARQEDLRLGRYMQRLLQQGPVQAPLVGIMAGVAQMAEHFPCKEERV